MVAETIIPLSGTMYIPNIMFGAIRDFCCHMRLAGTAAVAKQNIFVFPVGLAWGGHYFIHGFVMPSKDLFILQKRKVYMSASDEHTRLTLSLR